MVLRKEIGEATLAAWAAHCLYKGLACCQTHTTQCSLFTFFPLKQKSSLDLFRLTKTGTNVGLS